MPQAWICWRRLVAFADHAGDLRGRARRARSLSLLAIVLLGAFVVIMPLAHAHAPDPAWISGIYDGADYDDISAFLTETSLASAPDAIPIGPSSIVAPSAAGSLTAALKIDACLARRPRAPPIAWTKSTFRVNCEGPIRPVRSSLIAAVSPCGIEPGCTLSNFTNVPPDQLRVHDPGLVQAGLNGDAARPRRNSTSEILSASQSRNEGANHE